jgi:hypothetical protein
MTDTCQPREQGDWLDERAGEWADIENRRSIFGTARLKNEHAGKVMITRAMNCERLGVTT